MTRCSEDHERRWPPFRLGSARPIRGRNISFAMKAFYSPTTAGRFRLNAIIPMMASALAVLAIITSASFANGGPATDRFRILIETDAGGDPDDEQSLVRFLLYANEWDVEGIIANRPVARPSENLNPERTGPGIVRRLVNAYGQCYPNLSKHDEQYPKPEVLLARTVAGYDETDEA